MALDRCFFQKKKKSKSIQKTNIYHFQITTCCFDFNPNFLPPSTVPNWPIPNGERHQKFTPLNALNCLHDPNLDKRACVYVCVRECLFVCLRKGEISPVSKFRHPYCACVPTTCVCVCASSV